jgi:hypothetical protein
MAEQKKRGFGALEQRIHDMEADDRRREQEAAGERREAPRSEPAGERKEGRKE